MFLLIIYVCIGRIRKIIIILARLEYFWESQAIHIKGHKKSKQPQMLLNKYIKCYINVHTESVNWLLTFEGLVLCAHV